MRIDPTATHRPTDVNSPEQQASVKPSEIKGAAASAASPENKPRNHLVRERRRKNRRVDGPDRRGKGRRQGEQSAPTVGAYDVVSSGDRVTEGPTRMVDIDC